jgi:hypothetical protein
MDQRVNRLIQQGDKLFADRRDLDQLMQEIALHFYPSMADITNVRSLGEDFAEHLTTSYPVIARRTLGDSLSAMLRPAALDTGSPGVWFSMRAKEDEGDDTTSREWLEWATGVQRRAMYDPAALFTRATKEGDHQFATFGQAPLSVELNRNRDTLLYRCWHIRDVVWQENAEGRICSVHRKWKPTALQLMASFGDKCSTKVKTIVEKDPHAVVECRHIVMDMEEWLMTDKMAPKMNQPYVSIYVDKDNDHIIEEVGSHSKIYVIPRWMTLPGSQYAYSPAVVSALPDARLIQAMTLTLLEAGEKYADPPMVGTKEAIRSDVQLFAGGFTWLDAEYDERLGAALQPAYDVKGGEGLRYAVDMSEGVKAAIGKAFYLDSLSLPPTDTRDMTAFEVGQRISEWIRRAMPIFEPMEFEYNAALCEATFDIMLREGAFGSPQDMPPALRGTDVQFRFESPLHESADRRKGQKMLEAKAALMEAAELDQTVVPMLNARVALRDALDGIGVPADWTLDDIEMQEAAAKTQERQETQELLAGLGAASESAKNLGAATQSFAAAQAEEPVVGA